MGQSISLPADLLAKKPTLWTRLPQWWSERLFAGEAAPPVAGRAVRVCEWLLVLAAAVLSFCPLTGPLQEPEETLYAEIPREMLAEGRLLVPVRHGQDYYDKPPLLYWLVMGAYRLCGVHDWAARLVSGGAAFLCVLAAYAWGKYTAGPRAALAGALVLCLSPRWAQLAPMVSMNALLALWVTVALAAAHRALARPRPRLGRGWWCVSALACGLGVLTKGPVAVALVAVPVLLYQWLDRHTARAGWSMWALYGGLVAAVALPWFVMLALQDASFLYYFVWIHHVRRVLDPIDHPQPFWYYGPVLFVGMLPWALLLPALGKHLLGRVGPDVPQRTGDLGFFLLAGGWSLLFFSAAGCKRPCYILPIMPPLALALGCTVDALCRHSRFWSRLWGGVAAVSFAALATAALFVLPWYADMYSVRGRIVPHRAACADGTPVLCYPHVWDGVSFYLERNDVRVYGPEQLDDMMTALQGERRSLVVVKEDASLQRFLDGLPDSLEFVPCGRQHPVAVGWVRRRGSSGGRVRSGG